MEIVGIFYLYSNIVSCFVSEYLKKFVMNFFFVFDYIKFGVKKCFIFCFGSEGIEVGNIGISVGE